MGSDAPAAAGHYRILLVQQGAIRLVSGGVERLVLPRSVVLIPPHGICRTMAPSAARVGQVAFCRSVIELETMGGAAEGLLGMLGAVRPGTGCEARVTRLPPAAFDEAWGILARLEGEEKGKPAGFETMRKLRLMELLVLLYRFGQPAKAPASEPGRFRIEDAVTYIQDHYAEELTLPGIASLFGVNPSYLSRLFARHAGTHLFEYVNRVRIQKSCLLLKRSAMSIVDVAFSVGYNNLSHFNRYFRRIMGMSPREYRNKSKK